jgi:lambda repressor-like predicted transcriptional regulator
MVHAPEILALEARAKAHGYSMAALCKKAGIFRQSWNRASARKRMEARLFDSVAAALEQLEQERRAAIAAFDKVSVDA